MSEIKDAKEKLRDYMRTVLRTMPRDKKVAAGARIACHVEVWLKKSGLRHSASIAYFKNLPDEIDTEALDALFISLNIHRFIPHDDHAQPPRFIALSDGSREESLIFDAIFVPGLAFDHRGHRLGRGKGYYDRVLATLKSHSIKQPVLIGLAMDEQILSSVPYDKHDIPMNYLCTPTLGFRPVFG